MNILSPVMCMDGWLGACRSRECSDCRAGQACNAEEGQAVAEEGQAVAERVSKHKGVQESHEDRIDRGASGTADRGQTWTMPCVDKELGGGVTWRGLLRPKTCHRVRIS